MTASYAAPILLSVQPLSLFCNDMLQARGAMFHPHRQSFAPQNNECRLSANYAISLIPRLAHNSAWLGLAPRARTQDAGEFEPGVEYFDRIHNAIHRIALPLFDSRIQSGLARA